MVDGTFLTDLPEVLRKNGMYNRVPEMIGMNEDDGTLWFLGESLIRTCDIIYLSRKVTEMQNIHVKLK